MLDKQLERQMREEQKAFGIQPGFKLFSMGKFGGMSQTSSARQDGEDNEAWWQENWIKTGDFCLRTLWDKGTPIYTATGGLTIIYFYFYNIGITNYVAIFLSDGTAVQVNTATGSSLSISSTANTFYNSSLSTQIPVASQWGSTYLLIANNFGPNNYWTWTGSNLYTSGSLSSLVTLTASGAGYTSAPTVVAYGGNGTGATFLATIQNGSVVNIQNTNPGTGYEPGDAVQLYISGGGSDSGVELQAFLSVGVINSVVITNPGSGYTAGTYSLGFSGGGGTGAAGTYTVDSSHTVVSTNITSGGSGYSSTPTVSFPSGGGTGATGLATFTAGAVSSVSIIHGGTNLTGTPTLTFAGGNGTGAVATATVSGGAITSVTVTNGGQDYTSPPAVIVQTGLNNAASADVTLMPFGISGTSMENFDQRVWIGHPYQAVAGNNGVIQTGSVFNVSAPESFSDFATSDGGVGYTSSDSFLRYTYVDFKQSNGYLYAFGDSSVSVISNVQTSGSPSTTTFNYQNSDPQTGVVWRDSLVPYNRTILFGNPFGVYGLYGGAVTKISKKMNNVFQNAVFPVSGGITPTSAVANIFSSKVFLMNMTIMDPFTNITRNAMVSWDETNWFISSQSSQCTFIGTQEINSDMQAWGTDGTNLFPLFYTPAASLSKKLSTKLYGQQNFLIQKEALGLYFQSQDLSSGSQGIGFTSITTDSETGSYPIPKIPTFPSGSGSAYPAYPVAGAGSGDVVGVNLGLTLTTSSEDMTLQFVGLGFIECGTIAMSSTAIQGTSQSE
jgi:hypothetical protein